MKPAIRVEGLSKQYLIGTSQGAGYRTLRESLSHAASRSWGHARHFSAARQNFEATAPDSFWALDDVAFDVQPGEVVGIIGRNGAGKSTLLKILSRITEPTRGRVTIRGRVGSLLEVGTGFHPELTGRENIYMNGSILGMTRREIARQFDEIVDFSGIEKFLETPVKRYSSGMYVRLAFAVAAHLQPEVLIVDEVLAVGDAEFQKKCLGKMQDVATGGRTVLFVSHNMAAVEALCTRGLWMNAGKLAMNDAASQVIAAYHNQAASSCNGGDHRFRPKNEIRNISRPDFEVQEMRITSAGRLSPQGYQLGEPLTIELDCKCASELVAPVFMFTVRTKFGQVVADFHSSRAGAAFPPRISGAFSVACTVPHLHLVPGEYAIRLAIKSSDQWFFASDTAALVSILPGDFFGTGKSPCPSLACIVCAQEWHLTDRDATPAHSHT